MIKAILFDLDETLFDRSGSLAVFLKDQYRRYQSHFSGVPCDEFQRRFIELDRRGYGDKVEAYRTLLDEFSIAGLTAAELLADFRRNAWENCRAFPGAFDVLEQFRSRGYKLGIVTNGSTQSQHTKITQSGLIDLVDIVLISGQEKVRKPNPRIFIRAAEGLGVRTQECVFVGDNPQADICGAHQVGMKTVWYTHGSSWPEDTGIQPEHTISQLTELLFVPLQGDSA